MKQVEISGSQKPPTKEDLSQEIERLQAAVNTLAVSLSTCRGNQLNYIWTNLAQARAYLATALDASQQLKDGEWQSVASDWQI